MYALNAAPPGTIYRGSPPPDPTRRAFVPNQIVLHVTHTQRLTRSALRALIVNTNHTLRDKCHATMQEDEITEGDNSYDFPMPVVSFPDDTQPQFSLVIAPLSRKTTDEDLLRLVIAINHSIPKEEEGKPHLKAAAPDWLNGGSQSGGSPTGGPGGRPAKAIKPSYTVGQKKWQLNLPLLEVEMPKMGDGSNVNVAILDTLPCLETLAQIYYLEHKKEQEKPYTGHPLVLKLLKPAGQVHFYPASYEDLAEIAGYRIECHEYPVADHGLFIAGLINELAPQANLHLIQILNDYGVGNTTSLTHGLAKLTALISNPDIKGPWVVNCSFMLDVPNCGHDDLLKFFPKIAEVEEWMKHCLRENPEPKGPHQDLVNMLEPVRAMCEFLDKFNDGHTACVVAAAGNDCGKTYTENDCLQEKDRKRPYARFPAAFAEVIGVAALKHGKDSVTPGGDPANYSNLADRPMNVGFAALGGEEGEDKGVLGMYLGDFPLGRDPNNGAFDFEVNTNGWGWWAGTSFATPMVSGLAAAHLSANALALAAAQPVRTIVTTGLSGISTGAVQVTNEKMLVITQG